MKDCPMLNFYLPAKINANFQFNLNVYITFQAIYFFFLFLISLLFIIIINLEVLNTRNYLIFNQNYNNNHHKYTFLKRK